MMAAIQRRPTTRRPARPDSFSAAAAAAPIELDPGKERRLHILFVVVLGVYGIFQSILYYGHQLSPNSDFFDFIRIGRELWSFQMPSSFKRAPVVGLLQVGISKLVGGRQADLTAGWLLNSILHPLNFLLLYGIARRLIGRSAFVFAALTIINPWVLDALVHPIAETTLLFFILLTFWLLFRRSRWAYLAASIATMTRYEGAALIMVAFVWDQIEAKTLRQRLLSLGLSVAASVPLALWMWGTYVYWDPSASHYLRHYGHRTCIRSYWGYLWQVTLLNWFRWPQEVNRYFLDRPDSAAEVQEMFAELKPWYLTVKIIGSVVALSGIVFGLRRRRWEILGMLLFFIPYFFVHSLRARTQPRYCMPVGWIVLLFCWYGLQQFWAWMNASSPPGAGSGSIPAIATTGWKVIADGLGRWVAGARSLRDRLRQNRAVFTAITIAGQIVIIVLALLWLDVLLGYLGAPRVSDRSPRSAPLLYVALGMVLLGLGAELYMRRFRFRFGMLTAGIVMTLMAVSNQFLVIYKLGDGQTDKEFRMLADWYHDNAKPGEILVTTLPQVVSLYDQSIEPYLIRTSSLEGETLDDVIRDCYRKNITYLAWDSRIGRFKKDAYYLKWRMGRVAELQARRDYGPLEFITQLKHTDLRYINLYRLRPQSAPQRIETPPVRRISPLPIPRPSPRNR
jgi:hypothetical protein